MNVDDGSTGSPLVVLKPEIPFFAHLLAPPPPISLLHPPAPFFFPLFPCSVLFQLPLPFFFSSSCSADNKNVFRSAMILATSCSSTNTDQPSPSEGSSSSSRRHRKKPYKSWLKDGVNGGPCSMQVVVRWLSANYTTKWRDDSDNRMPKKLLLQEILDQLQQVGIHHRLAKDVASKISTLQSNYRTAREWYDVIGSQWRKAGALETDVKSKVFGNLFNDSVSPNHLVFFSIFQRRS